MQAKIGDYVYFEQDSKKGEGLVVSDGPGRATIKILKYFGEPFGHNGGLIPECGEYPKYKYWHVDMDNITILKGGGSTIPTSRKERRSRLLKIISTD